MRQIEELHKSSDDNSILLRVISLFAILQFIKFFMNGMLFDFGLLSEGVVISQVICYDAHIFFNSPNKDIRTSSWKLSAFSVFVCIFNIRFRKLALYYRICSAITYQPKDSSNTSWSPPEISAGFASRDMFKIKSSDHMFPNPHSLCIYLSQELNKFSLLITFRCCFTNLELTIYI